MIHDNIESSYAHTLSQFHTDYLHLLRLIHRQILLEYYQIFLDWLLGTLLHLARTVCRRAERLVVRLKEEGEAIDDMTIKYLNRMSDCLFVLARFVNHEAGVQDVLWNPKK